MTLQPSQWAPRVFRDGNGLNACIYTSRTVCQDINVLETHLLLRRESFLIWLEWQLFTGATRLLQHFSYLPSRVAFDAVKNSDDLIFVWCY